MQIYVEDAGHENGVANLEPPGIGIPDQLGDDVVARDLFRSVPGLSWSNPIATSWLHQMSLIARPWPKTQMSHIQVAVISLENGVAGKWIRVASPDRKQVYVGEVVSANELRGNF